MTGFSARLADAARYLLGRSHGLAGRLGLFDRASTPVVYVAERMDWVIRQDALAYARAVNARHPNTMTVTDRPERAAGRIAHFGSQFLWQAWDRAIDPAARRLITFFHGKPEDGPEMARHIDYVLSHLDRLDRIVTASSRIEARLLSWGVPRDKLALVPLGIDLDRFRPPTPDERLQARSAFGVPPNRLVIGSFQKDGEGWDEGLRPKYIKGPDILVESLARLAGDFPIFVLLTGPARGYVKQGLEKAGIPYAHHVLAKADQVADAFHAIDLYLVTAREEGGPKAVLESLAAGVPLVSTRVGMAEDVLRPGENGFLVDAPDADAIAGAAGRLLSDPELARRLSDQGLIDIRAFGWESVGEMLYQRAYRALLEA